MLTNVLTYTTQKSFGKWPEGTETCLSTLFLIETEPWKVDYHTTIKQMLNSAAL